MSPRKPVVFWLVVAVLLAGLGAWWLVSPPVSPEGRARHGIEAVGSQIAGVAVKVESSTLDAEGRGEIRGLTVANPKGFKGKHALILGEVRTALDPATLSRDVVVIRELRLVAPEMHFERGEGGDNLALILKNIEASPGAAKNKDDGPAAKFIIESVVVTDGKLHLSPALVAQLPALRLREIGRKTNGVSAAEAGKQLWRALQANAATVAANHGAPAR